MCWKKGEAGREGRRKEGRQKRRMLLFKIYSRNKVVIGEGNGNPLQYSCLENPMDGGARSATVQGAAESLTTVWVHQLVIES